MGLDARILDPQLFSSSMILFKSNFVVYQIVKLMHHNDFMVGTCDWVPAGSHCHRVESRSLSRPHGNGTKVKVRG